MKKNIFISLLMFSILLITLNLNYNISKDNNNLISMYEEKGSQLKLIKKIPENVNLDLFTECKGEASLVWDNTKRQIKFSSNSANIKCNLTFKYDIILTLEKSSGTILKSNQENVTISGENYGELKCETTNASIATCTVTQTKLTVTGVNPGNATITVKDTTSDKQATYSATVTDITLGLSPTSGNTNVNKTVSTQITGNGYGTLSCIVADPLLATCSISGGELIITGKNPGTTTVTVKESFANKTVVYTVNIITTLYNKIIISEVPKSDAGVDYSYAPNGNKYISGTGFVNTPAQITNGLYYTENMTTYGELSTRVYFYRGRVDNNWVSFGGKLWRIVRTTSENGVKLLYAGDGSSNQTSFIGSSAFNTLYTSKYYTGYTYNTSGYTGTQTNSNVKTVVDNWYNANLKSYSSYLSTTAIFCADRSSETTTGTTSGGRWYPIDSRAGITFRPTFACPTTNQSRYTNSTSTGNGYLTNPIALLTFDEAMYAGVVNSFTGMFHNYSSYIFDNAVGECWWTMSPHGVNSYGAGLTFNVDAQNSQCANSLEVSRKIIPVISLKSCVTTTNGNGTKTSPYIISNSGC